MVFNLGRSAGTDSATGIRIRSPQAALSQFWERGRGEGRSAYSFVALKVSLDESEKRSIR
jgi:hypothetical protein